MFDEILGKCRHERYGGLENIEDMKGLGGHLRIRGRRRSEDIQAKKDMAYTDYLDGVEKIENLRYVEDLEDMPIINDMKHTGVRDLFLPLTMFPSCPCLAPASSLSTRLKA